MKFGSNVYKFTQYGEDLAGTKGRFHDIQDSCLAPLPVQRPTPLWFGFGRRITPIPPDKVLRRAGGIMIYHAHLGATLAPKITSGGITMSASSRTPFMKATVLAVASAAALATGAASAQTTVKFGVAAMSTSFTTSLMAGSNPEIYAKHGIKMDITDFRGNTNNCIAGVLSGAVDFCQVGSTSVSDAIQEGGNFRAVAIVTKPLGEIVLGAKQIARLGGVTAKSPLVDRVKAMKGLRITSSGQGTPHYLALDALMQVGGLHAEDLKFRPLFDAVAMQESIRNDQIDGSLWTVGTLGNILADGTGVSWINMAAGEVPTVSPMPYTMVIAMNPYIEKNTPTIVKMRAAMSESVTELAANPAKYSASVKAKYFPQMEQGAWDAGFKYIPTAFFPGATVPKSAWDYMLKLQAASTKKTYDKATYEKAVIPEAQMK